jgi:hypothetical protein
MESYFKHGYTCLDWFGSIDHENAYWCIPETIAIGRWQYLETIYSHKLISYLKRRFECSEPETDFKVAKVDERTVTCDSSHHRFELKTHRGPGFGYLASNPGTSLEKTFKIFLYRNSENERIVYARSPSRKDARVVGYPVLIILPRSTIIKQNNVLCSCGVALEDHQAAEAEGLECQFGKQPLIKTVTDDTPTKEIVELAFREKRICIFNRGFYGDQRDAYRILAKMLKELPFLILRGSFANNNCFCIGFREAGQIAPSGLKGMRGDYETNVKRELQTYIREARHLRTVLVLDFQRSSDIAKSIASQRDFLFIKRSTRDLIPDEYMWLFESIARAKEQAEDDLEWDKAESLPTIPTLKPWEAYILFPDGHYEKRYHSLPTFHHKRPDDTWAADANCEIIYLDKKDLDKQGVQRKIAALKNREEERLRQEDLLKEADSLHNEGSTWSELAKKYGWLDKDSGMPSGDRLKMAVRRWKVKSEVLLDAGKS